MSQIVVNPEILGGKPIIEGTRLSVEHVLGLLASGMSRAEIFEAYPELNEENLQLVLAYASRALRNEVIIDLPITRGRGLTMLPPLVTDINIAVPVVQFLRAQGVDVVSGREKGWHKFTDRDILREAHAMKRFVLTHDSDFGKLAVYRGQPITGIIYLRPGNRPPTEVIADLRHLLNADIDWTPPRIVVYQSGRIRLRRPTAIEV